MANIALDEANTVHVVQSIQQADFVTAEAIAPGAPVKINPATGLASNANGSAAGEARVWGIALGRAAIAAGTPVTVLRRGILDGYNLSGQDFDDPIYLSDTDATLADTAGTVSTVIGRVIPGTANLLGAAHDKLLSVEL